MASNDEQQPIHILFFPFIAPGHLIPVAAMAALFASRGIKCTILTTPVNATVIRSAVDEANNAFRGTDALAIHISTIPFPDVGLPPGVESVVGISEADLHKLLEGVQRLREPLDRFLAEHHPVPDAVVVDSFYLWAADVAAEHGIPRLSFLGSSLFARACNESLLRNNPFALAPDDPDAVVSLPELPHRVALRRSQVMDPRKDQLQWDYNQLVHAADRRSYGEVFNSFAELEPDYVEHYRTTLGRRVWLVGPVAHANASEDDMPPGAERCLRWLDEKPRGSVVYLAFGTLANFSEAELREVARGLQLSGKNFLWVMKSGGADTTADASEWMPEGFAELIDVGARGLLFRGWAPQRLILEHSAVGGFVTHCGWNSVLEAVSAGVTLVTWPRYADQFYNEKLVVEVLKMGVGVGAGDYASHLEVRREVISGVKIAEAIDGVMGGDQEAEAIRKKAMELRGKARSATDKGGTSYDDVGKLIHELMARRRSVHS
ncbi:scopoletin glucosyltransferase-like [Miscanthus floridulus]|uniref:scopoletin glucosyltransferase-like n=1 Tax=Miscanthus floridulus TaxID=154761 RepID=UPI00345840BF